MAEFRSVFRERHVVLPVIHVVTSEQALRNVDIAVEAGADGAFLINHEVSADDLLTIHAGILNAHPHFWIGVNCLGLEQTEVFSRISNGVKGVWADDAMIRENEKAQPDAGRVLALRRERNWDGVYFGGVAFKHQRPVNDLASATQLAAPYVDVVTTSGAGTGEAASPEKIRIMKAVLGEFPLAIASGITPENVAKYLPIADCFLIATGISKNFRELDPERTKELVKRVRSY